MIPKDQYLKSIELIKEFDTVYYDYLTHTSKIISYFDSPRRATYSGYKNINGHTLDAILEADVIAEDGLFYITEFRTSIDPYWIQDSLVNLIDSYFIGFHKSRFLYWNDEKTFIQRINFCEQLKLF